MHVVYSAARTYGTGALVPNTGATVSFLDSTPSGLSIHVDDQAPCFFLTNFVLVPRNSGTRGFFDFLVPMMTAENPDSHLSMAFKAVAMASLATRPNSKASRLMSNAISYYSTALKQTNVALQSSQHQLSDQTLAAVLLLGFFEVREPTLLCGLILTVHRQSPLRSPMQRLGAHIWKEQRNLSNCGDEDSFVPKLARTCLWS